MYPRLRRRRRRHDVKNIYKSYYAAGQRAHNYYYIGANLPFCRTGMRIDWPSSYRYSHTSGDLPATCFRAGMCSEISAVTYLPILPYLPARHIRLYFQSSTRQDFYRCTYRVAGEQLINQIVLTIFKTKNAVGLIFVYIQHLRLYTYPRPLSRRQHRARFWL